MFCTKCGSQIADDAAFCPQCGNAVAAAPAQQAVQPAMVAQAQQPVAPAQVQQPAVPVASVQQPYQPQQQVGATPPSQPAVRGCFGSAWDDVKNSPDWFKKVALMALIDLVPILNWVNVGFGWNWAKDLVMGKREGLSGKIVSGDNFKLGFYVFVLNLLAYVILYAEGFVLGFIPVLGMLAAVVLGVFAAMFLLLPNIRMALFGRLGAGFEVGKLFDAYKRNLGTLFCISVVPGLVAAGFGVLIYGAFALLVGVFGGTDLIAIAAASARYGYAPTGLLYGMGGTFVVIFLLFIVATYLELIAYRFCQLVTQRAVGHYIARNAPEWAGEAASAQQAASVAASAASYGQQQPVADAPVPVSSAAQPSTQPDAPQAQQAAGVASAPQVQELRVAVAPEPVAPAAQEPIPAANMASAVTGAGVAAPAANAVKPAAHAYVEPENYAFDETSVLPEMPEDLDTIVQPEGVGETVADAFDASLFQSATPQGRVAGQGDAVRLQPTVASGPLIGDNSDTMVLMEETQAKAAPIAQPVAGQRTLQLTRANGDTCVLSSFPVTIGKGSEADLVIDGNGAISRVHVRILRDGDLFAAEDLGSTNKTFIGAYELPAHTPTILSDGDVLKLANEALQVKVV